jgi:hypothetical protein
VDEDVQQNVTLLKAVPLEKLAKLMLKGGQLDAGEEEEEEEVCSSCLNVSTTTLRTEHVDTTVVQETWAKLVWYRHNM